MAKLLRRVIPTRTLQIYCPSHAPVPPTPSPILLPSACSIHVFSPMQAAPDASRSLNDHSPLKRRHTSLQIITTASVRRSPKHYLHLAPAPTPRSNQHLLPLMLQWPPCWPSLSNLYPAGKISCEISAMSHLRITSLHYPLSKI